MSKISDNIEKLRKERHLSLRQLSSDTGIAKSTISDWGKRASPTAENIETIANYFDVSIGFLFGRTENRNFHKDNLSSEATMVEHGAEIPELDETK